MSQKLPFTEDVMFVLFQSCLYHMRSKLTHLGIRKMQYFEEILFWWSIEINKANLKCIFSKGYPSHGSQPQQATRLIIDLQLWIDNLIMDFLFDI